MSDNLRLGIYDHFKGGVYLLTGFSIWASEPDGKEVVEYTSVTSEKRFARLLEEWVEMVVWPDGQSRPRFVYRGPDLETPEPAFKVKGVSHGRSD